MKMRVRYTEPNLYSDGLMNGKHGDWIDLRAAEDVCIRIGEYKMIPLGLCVEIPDGYEALVAPRSSTFKKFGIMMANSIGIIDQDYNGDSDEWHFPAVAQRATLIRKGDRICQFRLLEHQPDIEIEPVESLGNESRGGFGSTGTR